MLSLAAHANNPSALPVYRWFVDRLRPVRDELSTDSGELVTTRMVEESEVAKEKVTAFLRAADLGIRRLVIQPAWPSDLAEVDLERIPYDPATAADERAWDPFDESPRVTALHRRADGEEVAFSFDEDESAGTKQVYALAAHWLTGLAMGRVLAVDELHAKLHPLISRLLIEAFHEHRGQAQMVFTTHDCSLLDSDLFRRDQVWFTEKDETGATDLYSLWDYRPRKDENIRGGYLRGRYGAIPFVGELSL